uniref:Uncharacterized protein n=1 Tax=Siphoviridae sp. ctqSm5 TaxID=2827949 RepID=A0A8S5SP08_9CAUD|nr:MAG TPA: hypothetical protein [Siphoviridae sp. ctqSm5]DAJ60301.1 MAG TPA: hypothetical protein [Caudoviricetes sp.]
MIDSKVVAPDALAPSMVNEVMSLSISIEKKTCGSTTYRTIHE